MKRTYLARAVPILVASIAGAGLWACRDSTLPAHERIGPHVALALNPVFVAGAAAGIVPFEHARINLARIPGGAIALDTLVDFPPGVDQIAVRLEVPLSPDATSSGEDFTARFELINAAGVVVFVGCSRSCRSWSLLRFRSVSREESE